MLALNLMLAIAWLVLTGEFTPANFVFGFLLGFASLYIVNRNDDPAGRDNYVQRVPKLVRLFFYFLWTLLIANYRMVKAVLSPLDNLQPAIVAIPLDVKSPLAITLLANWITLTPGTLSLEVSEDNKVLYVHTFQVGKSVKAFRREIKEDFESWIIEVFES